MSSIVEKKLNPIITLAEFKNKNYNFVFKAKKKQVLLIGVKGKIYAIDNRCPHEGYPLSNGFTNDNCVLTCNWHNWKFNLKTGECLFGEDNVRNYPVNIENGTIYVDINELSKAQIKKSIYKGFKTAFKEQQYGRISREIVRLQFNNLNPINAVKECIFWSFDRFEYGMTHAYAACADWLTLYNKFNSSINSNQENQIICLTEAIDHISDDSLRHLKYPYTTKEIPFNKNQFLIAIENENEEESISIINGAIKDRMSYNDLKGTLAEAALAHYNSFGHALIYVYKAGVLANIFKDPKIDSCLLKTVTRKIITSTREDNIPEFKCYSDSLKKLQNQRKGKSASSPSLDGILNKKVNSALEWTVEKAKKYNFESLFRTLLLLNAKNMTTYNTDYQEAYDKPVSHNIGWLDFTHGLTFANAVHVLCEQYPKLWAMGILQMACFYGRNTYYTDSTINEDLFQVGNHEEFKKNTLNKILDHGIRPPIFSAHYLKTSLAIFEEGDQLNQMEREILYRPLKRFFDSPLKAKHIKRVARQTLQLISKDYQ